MKKLLILSICILLVGCSKEEEAKECPEFVGGSFTLKYETNGADTFEDVSVCIACSPSSYEDLKTPTKKGYKFTGWFLDEELTKKIDGTSTLDVEVPDREYDADGCATGYKDVTIYAGWSKK